jgi:hypothetical protein
MPGVALAPSAVKLDIGKQSKRFATPSAMTERDIQETIGRTAATGRLAEKAGFDGVEIHAAHGYLLPSSSPRTQTGAPTHGAAACTTVPAHCSRPSTPCGPRCHRRSRSRSS